MSEPQPEYIWAYPDEKPKRSKVWLIVVLAVVAVAIAAAVFFLFLRPGAGPAPTPSDSASAAPTDTPSPSPSETSTPTPTPTSSATPAPVVTTTPPAPSDPAIPVFRGKVQPMLEDAATGLSYARDSSGQEGVQLVDQLRDDAGRLSDTVAPQSIAQQWSVRTTAYGKALDKLHAAFSSGSSTAAALAAAQSALDDLNALIAG